MMSFKKIALIALASTALAAPAYASNAEIDQLMKEINKLKSQVNALQKKAAEPAASAAPVVNSVKACEAQGDGFFVIPGTATCLRLSGYARAEGTYSQLKGKDTLPDAGDKSEIAAAGRLRLNTDFRSSTDMGTLRGFLRMHLNMGSGSSRSVGSSGADTDAVTSFSTSADLAYAYVTLGGWSAGRQDSAFLFYNGADAAFIPSDDGVAPISASYTLPLGTGLSATLSVENPLQRSIVKNTKLGNPNLPDLVGAVQAVNGPWTFKLAGASHQVVDEDTSTTAQGYAVQGGVKYVVSPDTTFWMQGTYAKGAMSYLGYGIASKWSDVDNKSGADFVDEGNNAATTSISGDASNCAALPAECSLTLSSGWSVLGALNQKIGSGNWALIGTYGKQENYSEGIPSSATNGGVQGTIMQIETNYTFKPYSGLNIQPAVAYQRWDLDQLDPNSAFNTVETSTDRYSARLRVWREF